MCKKDFGFSRKKSGGSVAPEGWQRPTEWITIPSMSVGDKKFAGLFAIFNDRHNECGFTMTLSYNATIDWGDGTSITGTGYPWSQNKVYNYASINSPILTDEFNRTYKHVLITVTFHPLETGFIDFFPVQKSPHWLDVKIQHPMIRTFNICGKKPICLKILDISNFAGALNQNFANLELLEFFNFTTNTTTVFNPFARLGRNVKNLDGSPFQILYTASDVSSGLSGADNIEFGEINLPNATNCSNFLRVGSQKIGDITIPVATNLTNFCYEATNLRKVKLISSSALTNLNQSFHYARALEDLEITDCSGVTTTNLFTENFSLKRLILTGLTRGVNISNQNHDADSLNAFFTSLGTASGAQNITITGNPGASTCNQSIATTKGWTVIN